MFSDMLLRKSRDARARYFLNESDLMRKLTHGQKPEILYIGCSDSRIMPSRILGAKPGDVFVMRNIANLVPPVDAGMHAVGAVLEYAVYHLLVKHIVVCGHTMCGGIQSLGLPPDPLEPSLSMWLQYAEPAMRRIPQGLRGVERLDAIIEANVLLQIEHLRTYPCVKNAEERGELILHPWVYDFATGQVRAYDAAAGIFITEPPFVSEE
ncbi:MAG: carbonic anhydrase [Anaerolineae bacterium]|nr:carbonic anhydrase [Anaerolineae bacterium]